MRKYNIVTICGHMPDSNKIATRIYEELMANGVICFKPHIYNHVILTREVKQSLVDIHKSLISMSDHVFLVGDSFGRGSKEEIMYALSNNKKVQYATYDDPAPVGSFEDIAIDRSSYVKFPRTELKLYDIIPKPNIIRILYSKPEDIGEYTAFCDNLRSCGATIEVVDISHEDLDVKTIHEKLINYSIVYNINEKETNPFVKNNILRILMGGGRIVSTLPFRKLDGVSNRICAINIKPGLNFTMYELQLEEEDQ